MVLLTLHQSVLKVLLRDHIEEAPESITDRVIAFFHVDFGYKVFILLSGTSGHPKIHRTRTILSDHSHPVTMSDKEAILG